MKVKATKDFFDLKEKKHRTTGEAFEADKARADKLAEIGFVTKAAARRAKADG